jgi:putative chitinase
VLEQARLDAALVPGKQAADQRAIANIVYGGDWGRKNLGNVAPGDGWIYRGRGPIQITGRANYERVGDLIGQNLVGVPDLLSQPRFALDACIAWWEDGIPDSMLGETTSIRKRVNGGTLGLAEVQALTIKVKAALGANHA